MNKYRFTHPITGNIHEKHFDCDDGALEYAINLYDGEMMPTIDKNQDGWWLQWSCVDGKWTWAYPISL